MNTSKKKYMYVACKLLTKPPPPTVLLNQFETRAVQGSERLLGLAFLWIYARPLRRGVKRYGVLHPYPLPSLWRSSPGWLRNFPGLITASRFLWDFCKKPGKSSFFVIFGLATTVVACTTQLQIVVLFHDFWRF